MTQRRFHYEQAFEHYLRSKQIPYVAVDEAKKAMHGTTKLKSFDVVVYSDNGPNLLVDVKGRKHSGKSRRALDNWVTEDDVRDLGRWSEVFGDDFQGCFVFLYWCAVQPPDALFHEIFSFGERWYAVLACSLSDYRKHMKRRSERWNTVHIPAATFGRIAQPFATWL